MGTREVLIWKEQIFSTFFSSQRYPHTWVENTNHDFSFSFHYSGLAHWYYNQLKKTCWKTTSSLITDCWFSSCEEVVGIDLRSIQIFQAVAVFFTNCLSIYIYFFKSRGWAGENAVFFWFMFWLRICRVCSHHIWGFSLSLEGFSMVSIRLSAK